MRHWLFCLLAAGVVCCGCSGRVRPDAETRFFREFSLSEMVGRVAAPEVRAASASNGSAISPGRGGRREFSLAYALSEGEGTKFDEAGFIIKLKVATERAADDAGVRRHGGGLSGDAFYFEYTGGDYEGWVEVVGTRMEGGRYKVWGVIIERKEEK